MTSHFTVHPITPQEFLWVKEMYNEHWGADFVVTRGKKYFASDIQGFYVTDNTSTRIGLATYRIDGDQCEFITLNSFTKFAGIGSMLVGAVKQAAKAHGCQRLWLITTNDNMDAIRFYQRRGFTFSAVYCNALADSRKLKPGIPMIGEHGIPLRDELEFEMFL